jgi:hypothetical protein
MILWDLTIKLKLSLKFYISFIQYKTQNKFKQLIHVE